jgi:DNA-binding ferritin-like protein (Dps family)
MTITIEPSKHVTSLASAARLIAVDVSVWTGTRTDKRLSDKLADENNADRDAVATVKKLLAGCAEHRALINNRQTIYNWLKVVSYEWCGSLKVVPNNRMIRVRKDWAEHQKRTAKLEEEFYDAYPFLVANKAVTAQGDLYNKHDYPTVAELRARRAFSAEMTVMDVPVDDFRTRIAMEAVEDERAHYQKRTREMLDTIVEDMSANLAEVMRSIAHCCEVTTTVGDNGEVKVTKRKLYEDTITKALEMCDTIGTMASALPSHLIDTRTSLENVLRDMSVPALKESITLRAQVHEEVSDILSKFRV